MIFFHQIIIIKYRMRLYIEVNENPMKEINVHREEEEEELLIYMSIKKKKKKRNRSHS